MEGTVVVHVSAEGVTVQVVLGSVLVVTLVPCVLVCVSPSSVEV